MTGVDQSFGIVPLIKQEGIWYVFLILHKGGSHWGFPKGHGNPGETPVESARRELKEETGLEVVSLLCETPFIEHYQFKRRGKLVAKTVHYFPATVTGKVLLQTEEINEGKWVTLKEALSVLTFHEAREICHQIAQYVETL